MSFTRLQPAAVAVPNVCHAEDRSRGLSEGHLHRVDAHKEALTSTQVWHRE